MHKSFSTQGILTTRAGCSSETCSFCSGCYSLRPLNKSLNETYGSFEHSNKGNFSDGLENILG